MASTRPVPRATPVATCVTDVEIGRLLAPLDGLGAYGAVRAVARLGGVPVAGVQLPVRDGRVGVEALVDALAGGHAAELTRYLLRRWLARAADVGAPAWDAIAGGDVAPLAALPDPPDPPLPAVTVAVCTRDRPDDLARCLTALAALDYPEYQVLVVDNAPRTDATERLVRDQFGGMRYVREPRPGLDWARNRAIVEATGEVLAFTDDDVVVDPGWLRALGRVFGASPAVMAVTGMIEPAELETRAQVDFEAYCGFGHGWARRWTYQPRRAGHAEYRHHSGGALGTGANMAYRRALFDTLGGFDPALDVGTVTQGGGDIEMFFRVVQEGQLLVYAPEAFVRHRHRRGYDELRRQLGTWGSGYHAFLRRSRRAYPEEHRAFDRLAWWWWGEYVVPGILLGSIGRRPAIATLRRHELFGTLRGLRSYDRAARRARDLLARYPDEPTVLPRPSAARGAAPDLERRATRTVSIDAPVATPLEDVGEVATVQLLVTAHGRPVAEAVAVPECGRVSVAQLHDVIAAALTRQLLTDASSAEAATRSLAGWLGGSGGAAS
ncbi:hypothetical protein tb265_15500 [Gemmatimonadetes bacterium T265]|nr:hypothetical protein tb265_15500 [Gemmatimonadetes bacterium T265]